ncbi:MAG: cytochrome c oxidase subunit 3 [Chitinophagaceae bacterium]|nr:cytochrome c oxidase subunit 3 [Chitinophagaceae bacterium]
MEAIKPTADNPPGGILIWLLMMLELFTFSGAILFFLIHKKNEYKVFETAKKTLSPTIGTINTIVLIGSGFFIANAIQYLKGDEKNKAVKYTTYSLLLGILFLIIKSTEYYLKLNSGISFNENIFFNYYWLLTGFHFVHVLFGIGLLYYLLTSIKHDLYHKNNTFDAQSIATYWHICDLIWIIIFPVLYLI